MRIRAFVIFATVLFFPWEATTSRLHHRYVSLETIVQQSMVIVVAQRVDGSRQERTVSLGQGVVPYAYADERYRVVEGIRGLDDIAPGAEIVVTSFSSSRLRHHMDYYLRGRSVSRSVTDYKPDEPLKSNPNDPRLLFLERRVFVEMKGATPRTRVDALGFVTPSAVLDVERKAEVAALAEALSAPSFLMIGIGNRDRSLDDGDEAAEEILRDWLRKCFPEHSSFSLEVVDLPDEHGAGR